MGAIMTIAVRYCNCGYYNNKGLNECPECGQSLKPEDQKRQSDLIQNFFIANNEIKNIKEKKIA